MGRFRKILVAYDGSESAKNALREACRLAKAEQAWIKLLAVVPPYEGDLDLIAVHNIKEAIEGPGRKLLEEAEKIAEAEEVNVLKDLEQGEPYERIVAVAEDESCDLIVMGRKGMSAIERELVGSVTARVIGHTTKDVLVVPEGSRISWEKILVATDNSPNCRPAVEHAFDIAKEHGSKIAAVTVVYSNDEFFTVAHQFIEEMIAKAREKLDELKEEAGSMGLDLVIMVKEGEPHKGIAEAAEEFGATTIVMGSHGRTGLSRLLMGSVTERVIGFASCPVLVCHLSQ